MKNKVDKKSSPELDKFDRRQKKHVGTKSKSSKGKLSIYDEFEDEDLMNFSSDYEELED
jgi:hypothetical protein